MKYKSVNDLMKDFEFILPKQKDISVKGGKPVSRELLKMLILATGGELLSLNQLREPDETNNKTRIRIHHVSEFSRLQIDERLSEASSQESCIPKVSTSDTLLVDYHWVFDCIYSQKLKPLRIYKVE